MRDPSPVNDPLTIRRVDVIPMSLPLLHPVLMGSGQRIMDSRAVVVRIEAADGTVGWGEASAAPMMTGETIESMHAAVRDHLRPYLEGKDLRQRAAVLDGLHGVIVGNSGAKAACDIAIHDLVGHRLGVPVHELLGGRLRMDAMAMHMLGNASADDDLAEASARQRAGYRLFKLKVGTRAIDEDIALARCLRAALGEDALLCADANMGLSAGDARRFAAGVSGLDLLFLEQPFAAHALTRTVALAREGGIALCADESASDIATIRAWAEAGAITGVNLKTIKAGGLRALHALSAQCHAIGLAIDLAAKVAESSIGAAALGHLALSIANVDWGASPTSQYLAEDVVRQPLHPLNGRVGNDPRFRLPGLGVEVDEDALSRNTLDLH